MNYKITKFQKRVLEWIARKIVVQSPNHKQNIIEYLKIIKVAIDNEFTEDNNITKKIFLGDCLHDVYKQEKRR